MGWNYAIDPDTGDYALDASGAPVTTHGLDTPVQLALKDFAAAWWGAPQLGSDLHALTRGAPPADPEREAREAITRALAPLADRIASLHIEVTPADSGRPLAVRVRVTDSETGLPVELELSPAPAAVVGPLGG